MEINCMAYHNHNWPHEKRFIDGLGTWGNLRCKEVPDLELLQKYFDALQLRQDNPNWIEDAYKYCEKLLKKARRIK